MYCCSSSFGLEIFCSPVNGLGNVHTHVYTATTATKNKNPGIQREQTKNFILVFFEHCFAGLISRGGFKKYY